MPLAVQTRLLRVLQEGIVQPVGSGQRISVDVRVVSATHQDLEQAIKGKAFRNDLYYRIRGIELHVGWKPIPWHGTRPCGAGDFEKFFFRIRQIADFRAS